jgi:hypothetical protein
VKLAGAHVRYEAVDGVGWITLTRPQVLNGSTMPTRQTLVAWGCGGLGEEETERMVSMDLAIDAEGWHAFLKVIRLR